MKKLYIITLISLLTGMSILATAQPTWQWAKSAGGINNEDGYAIATDINGNVLVTGQFKSASIAFGTTTLTNSNGNSNIFVVKYDATGNVLWAKSAGGQSDDEGKGIATDANGNVFVAGYFSSTFLTFGTTTLINAGYADIFIVKYDASGNVLWAKSAGGNTDEYCGGLSTDASGNLFFTGTFYSGSIHFGATTLTNVSAGYGDFFVAKYNPSGNVLWVKSAGGDAFDDGTATATDANGNVLVSGHFSSTSLIFGTTTLTNTNIGSDDIFVVKYDASGNVVWAKSADGSDYDYATGIATDASGNVLVTGFFQSASLAFGTTTLTNAGGGAGSGDIFIVKYTALGNVLWAKSAGGTSDDYGLAISTDASGNLLLTGYFFSASIPFGTTTLMNVGLNDIFVGKYNASGNVLWAKSAGGSDYDAGQGIAIGANGNVLVTGYFASPSNTFGTITLTNADGSNFNYDFFIADLVNDCDENINKWIGVINEAWEEPGNWSCGVIPGPQTDVFLNGGTVVVSSNVEIRSLTCKTGVNFNITPGSNFIINH